MTTPQENGNPAISDSLIRKIQLLLNLAKGGAHGGENEAASAMAKAQELLAKYNLELSEVTAAKVAGGTAVAMAETKREKTKLETSAMYEWQWKLCRTIAESNFCVYWTQRGNVVRKGKNHNSKVHIILGREANVIATQIMYAYLVDTMYRILPFEENLSREANSWKMGCVDRLCERIQEKARKMREQDSPSSTPTESGCTALAIRNLEESERIANYDAQRGVGAWAKSQARQKENEACRALADKKKEEEQAIQLAAETPEQRARRIAKELKEQEKAYDRWYRYCQTEQNKRDRTNSRIDSGAYRQGAQAGKEISLADQVSKGREPGKLGS